MPNRRLTIKQSTVARVLRAARRAGAERVDFDYETGKFSIIVGGKANEAAAGEVEQDNPWDEVLTDVANEERPA